MDLEITPQPSEEERAAIEAALGEDVQGGRSSGWPSRLLPQREDLPEPYPEGPLDR